MSYNGWRNYETWNAALWMSNDQGTHEFWIERAEELVTEHEGDKDAAASDLAREMESECDENVPDLGASMYADILGTSLQEIDWREVAEHYTDDAEYTPDTDDGETDEADDADAVTA